MTSSVVVGNLYVYPVPFCGGKYARWGLEKNGKAYDTKNISVESVYICWSYSSLQNKAMFIVEGVVIIIEPFNIVSSGFKMCEENSEEEE